MIISLFAGVAYSGLSPEGNLVDQLIDMEYKTEFMDMLNTFHDLSESGLDGFSSRYSDVMNALDSLHEIDLTENDVNTQNNVIFDYFVDLVKDPSVDEDTLTNMGNYLDSDDRSSMLAALSERTAKVPEDVTDDMINR